MRLSRQMVVHGIWLSGLGLTIGLGILARETLSARGVDVVSIERGIKLLLPFAIWANMPFFALATLVAWRLKKTLTTTPNDFSKMVLISLGSWAGTAVVQGISLFQAMTYTGPGGFAEVVGMMIALSVITIPAMILSCAVGAAIGGVLGALVYALILGPKSGTAD
ncbi:hypothetical protein [Celeribacter sp. PS-C1]|uniref:hypothetical protein n=1 Tax=Celeribacter sp. PS-C1 TaxID=2820813 RepID=UPI001CA554DA|nr:hypothetical protein [Celeribacter sp. PS-C1]MBW6418852.1 hypothetical protein [Celeribacter sp. PS-C1]